jgi:hypothetical protein
MTNRVPGGLLAAAIDLRLISSSDFVQYLPWPDAITRIKGSGVAFR